MLFHFLYSCDSLDILWFVFHFFRQGVAPNHIYVTWKSGTWNMKIWNMKSEKLKLLTGRRWRCSFLPYFLPEGNMLPFHLLQPRSLPCHISLSYFLAIFVCHTFLPYFCQREIFCVSYASSKKSFPPLAFFHLLLTRWTLFSRTSPDVYPFFPAFFRLLSGTKTCFWTQFSLFPRWKYMKCTEPRQMDSKGQRT